MKVEPTLIVAKGQADRERTPARPRKKSSPAKNGPPSVVLLISRENQQAWQLTPQSIKEAEQILKEIQQQLARESPDLLTGVHGLVRSCLVTLP
jgi:hypothetical protein